MAALQKTKKIELLYAPTTLFLSIHTEKSIDTTCLCYLRTAHKSHGTSLRAYQGKKKEGYMHTEILFRHKEEEN